jgi:hypothetical protein
VGAVGIKLCDIRKWSDGWLWLDARRLDDTGRGCKALWLDVFFVYMLRIMGYIYGYADDLRGWLDGAEQVDDCGEEDS